jgi:hypothetical protein
VGELPFKANLDGFFFIGDKAFGDEYAKEFEI